MTSKRAFTVLTVAAAVSGAAALGAGPASAADLSYESERVTYDYAPTAPAAYDFDYGYARRPAYSYGPGYAYSGSYTYRPGYAYGPAITYGPDYANSDHSYEYPSPYPTPRYGYDSGSITRWGTTYSPSVASEYVVPAQPGYAYRSEVLPSSGGSSNYVYGATGYRGEGYAYGDQGSRVHRTVKKHVRVSEHRSRTDVVHTKSRERVD